MHIRWDQFSGIGRSLNLRYPPHLAFVLLAVINGVIFAILRFLGDPSHNLWQSGLVGFMSGVTVGATWVLARELDPDYELSAFVALPLTIISLFLLAYHFPAAPLFPPLSALLTYGWLIVMLRILTRSTGLPVRLIDLVGLLGLTAWYLWQGEVSYGFLATAVFLLGATLPKPQSRQRYFALASLLLTFAALILITPISQLWTPVPLSLLVTAGLLMITLLFFPVILSYYRTDTTGDVDGKPLTPLRIQTGQAIALALALLSATWQGVESLSLLLPLWTAILGISLYRLLPEAGKRWLDKAFLRTGTTAAFLSLLLVACQPVSGTVESSTSTTQPQPALAAVEATTATNSAPGVETIQPTTTTQATPQLLLPPPTLTPIPTSPATETPLPTPTPTVTPTATAVALCADRMPTDDLLTIVTLQYGLSRDYAPADLVPLSDYLEPEVTLGYPTEIRQEVAEPLVQLIHDMQAVGLRPFIISGYRSYSAQAIARQKWVEKAPEYVDILSAPPGHSEHQLGTVIDFGSPELPEIVGQEDIEFHTYFYMTSEGIWLAENAHRYGFTLSYPREAQEITGFFYEPWHYRYVGVELATRLREMDVSLTEYQFTSQPLPCIPEETP